MTVHSALGMFNSIDAEMLAWRSNLPLVRHNMDSHSIQKGSNRRHQSNPNPTNQRPGMQMQGQQCMPALLLSVEA